MIFLRKVWTWIKKYWQIIAGFVAALGGFVIVREVLDNDNTEVDLIPPDLNEEANKAVIQALSATEMRDQKLLELAELHKTRLDLLNDDQEKELEELTEKPIEEVVAWFDKL